jgi:hypothetical protein
MERSEIRDCLSATTIPDCAALHPGYDPSQQKNGRLIGRPFLFVQLRHRSRVIAIATAIVAVEAVGIVVQVIIIMRGLIEEALP